MSKQWLIDGGTESGDDFCYTVSYYKRPTEDQIDEFISREWPEEYVELGFTYWEMSPNGESFEQTQLLSPKKATKILHQRMCGDEI